LEYNDFFLIKYFLKNRLTKEDVGLRFIHSMNELVGKVNEGLLHDQALQLQGIIGEIVRCCDDRKFFETEKFGIPYAELKCLLLFEGESNLTVKGIAQKLDVVKSRVTKIVNGLMKKGLVRQIDDPSDARIKLISLTPVGQKKAQEIDAFQRELHRQILLRLDADERKGIFSYLELLRSAMQAVKEQLV
jgi:DNA-binding MarR family transcriptional regulator